DGGRWAVTGADRSVTDRRSSVRPSSVSERQRDQPERSHDDAPPGEQAKAVALHVVEERFHHDPGAHERHGKSESHDDGVVHAHPPAALIKVVGEGPGHSGHREPEREFRGRAAVGAQQHGATMVAPERETPGIMDTHCAKPMTKKIGSENFVASWQRVSRSIRATHCRIAPPTIRLKQTIQTLNTTDLMTSWASAPPTAAGRNAISTPRTKRRAAGSLNMPVAMCQIRKK